MNPATAETPATGPPATGQRVQRVRRVRRFLRTAVIAELRLNAGRVATTLIACAVALLLALALTDQYAGLLTIWAALAWYRYGRADTIERDQLRASLGLSRADTVRARLVLIVGEHAAVIATVAAGALISVLLGRETAGGAAPFSVAGDPSDPQISIVLVGALFSAVTLLLTGILVGGECTVRRPGRSMAVLSVVVYFLAGLLLTIPVMLTGISLGLEFGSGELATVIFGALLAVAGVALAVVLRARARSWIRDLDSGRAGE